MPTTFETGDIFSTPNLNAFAHGCNCAGAMGRGIAVVFREKWPCMYDAYKKMCQSGEFKLGDVFTWNDGSVTIFNLATQKSWKTKADIVAINNSVQKMVSEAERMDIISIGLPKIGAGLGGLDWIAIKELLYLSGSKTRINLRVCEILVEGSPMKAI